MPVFALSLEEKRFLLETAFLLRDARRYDEAEAVFQGLYDHVEGRHIALVGIGSVHFGRGDLDRAIEVLERAIGEGTESALAHAHLGEALAFAGHREEARLVLETAVRLDPAGRDGGTMAKWVLQLLESDLI